RGKEPMKRFAFAFGLIGASVAGCTSFDSRVAVRSDGLSKYTQVVSESESSPRPAPLATRWQKMMVRIRENCRPDTAGGGGAPQEMAQGPDLAPVTVSGPSQVAVHADGQQVAIHADAHQVAVQAEDQPSAVHAAETIRHQKATRLPSTTSVVQASASQTSSPKTLPSEP